MAFLQLDPSDRAEIDAMLRSAFLTPNALAVHLSTSPDPEIAGVLDFSNRNLAVNQLWQQANARGTLDRILVHLAATYPDRLDVRAIVFRLAATCAGWTAQIGRHGLDRSGLERLSARGNPFMPIAVFGSLVLRAERQVCQVRCGAADAGTGYLVGPDLVLTCYHVVEKHLGGEVPASDVQVRFDYREAPDGSPPASTLPWHDIDAGWTIPSSAYDEADITLVGEPPKDKLDYALLRLARRLGETPAPGESQPRGWLDLSRDPPMPIVDAPIIIAQYPRDANAPAPAQRPMQLTFATPGFVGLCADGTRMKYVPSTEPGSSGAPVFGPTGLVIALHHNRGQINPAAVDLVKENRGIPIAAIRSHLGDKAALFSRPPW
ncbi:MAG: trypsin-like peptidase domain-containing protein [Myxococcales bacterium]|nr:trypsin-like peptidase domain-containing protein [Myxococcales bacterium]